MNWPVAPTPPSAATRTAKAVTCLACGASITLRALGQSVMVACPACRTQLDVSRPEISIIQKYTAKATELPLPLGTRGTLRGQLFEVIGVMQRSVTGYQWKEYLLFNPYIGFRWLVNDQGHWNFGEMLKDTSAISLDSTARYRGRVYRKIQAGNPKVDWVLGELYWRVQAAESVRSTDYVSPPYLLSREETKDEVTWTRLEYIEPEEIEAAFGIDPRPRSTIGANQPNPASRQLRAILPIAIAALVAAVAVQVMTVSAARNVTPISATYQLGKDHPAQQVFGPIEFSAPYSLNEFEADAALTNNWVELDASLVNRATHASYDFNNAFEFYSGSSSDGPWSEGSREHTSLVTSVPAGTYDLLLEGASGTLMGSPVEMPVRFRLNHGATS
jgi:hypothetical protein